MQIFWLGCNKLFHFETYWYSHSIMRFFTLLAFFIVTLQSCSTETPYKPVDSGDDDYSTILNLPVTEYNYSNIQLPAYFYINDNGAIPSAVTGTDNTPANNAITDAGATLGRVLFYDRNLSLNRTTACGSCHRAEKSYADSGALSQGLNGINTRRNSITLVNARFYRRGHFFYDERAATLEDQVLMPMFDHTEMDMTADLIIQRIREQPYYHDLFVKAFGTSNVTLEHIEQALAQFIRSMVSFTSKYDAGRAQVANMADAFPNFTEQENRGKDLFLKPLALGGLNCYACHYTEAFICPDRGPINNGLDIVSTIDKGAFEFSGIESQKGAYKIPTLRNIVFTGPYMHDGRFNSLSEVVEFYNSGVQNHAQLSPLLKGADGLPRRLNLSEEDKAALIRFLNTLTDNTIQADPRWLDPFINQHL